MDLRGLYGNAPKTDTEDRVALLYELAKNESNIFRFIHDNMDQRYNFGPSCSGVRELAAIWYAARGIEAPSDCYI